MTTKRADKAKGNGKDNSNSKNNSNSNSRFSAGMTTKRADKG
jgi:hypothetical protein